MPDNVYRRSLDYHRFPQPGKLAIVPTKPLSSQEDLSLAYSPGVAEASRVIASNPQESFSLTSRSNLIAVVTNGTAVLGLGNIGALAAKPVMEGKAVLFKKFANIDAFDIEIDEKDPAKLIDIIASLAPTFGGINLEDIKAPECFEIEKALSERLNIPVFHDDQHGTAIIVGAAVKNGLKLVNKDIGEVKLVTSGAGAGATACVELLLSLGLKRENVIMTDSKGVLNHHRTDLDPAKNSFVRQIDCQTLAEALVDADIFLGLSVAKVVTPDMIKHMAPNPLVFALANPEPEILPPLIIEARPDAIFATGRSDYPNQVNNVLCFPYIFRGALDVGATKINEKMKIACVNALADLAQAESSEAVSNAYGGEVHRFGPDYIIPKPFDPRLLVKLASVVAQAAMDSGVATRPIKDINQYHETLKQFSCRSSMLMKPIVTEAKKDPKRIVFAEGEEERVLQAVQILVDDQLAKPIIIGRPDIIQSRIKKLGLRIKLGKDVEIVDPNQDSRFPIYWKAYHSIVNRRGITPAVAKKLIRTDCTVIGAMMVQLGDADGLICGTIGRYVQHLRRVREILGRQHKDLPSTLSTLILDSGPLFITDAYVHPDPTAAQIVDMTLRSVQQVKQFGVTPKVALVSHSSFGSSIQPSAVKMREAYSILTEMNVDFEFEGEMHSDAALSPTIRNLVFPDASYTDPANILVMPCLDSAHAVTHAVKVLCNAQMLGPIIMGLDKTAHILTHAVDVRGIVDMATIAVVDAQLQK